MKKQINFILLSLFVLMFVATSCSRTDDFMGNSSTSNYSAPKIRSGISGRVTDENHLPVKNAIVTAYGKVVQTDINGEFVIRGLDMPKYYGYVKAEKPQYFMGSRTFVVSSVPNALNHVEIQLIPKTLRGTFAANQGGTITFSGVSLTFEPGSVALQSNGLPYNGTVKLVGAHLNPEDADFSRIMPGNLVGEVPGGLRQGLESFGMIAVELEGASGEKLQILKGKTANMKMDVPISKLASAPASLPLWYFDENTGMWKEEGKAILQNGQYVGELAHFSFWNCDYGGPIINLEATFVDVNGNPVTNVPVSITATSINDTRCAWTDNNGTVSGGMPYNSPLVISVVDNCGNIIYTQNAGPYTTNTNLGTITINSPNYVAATYTGTVTDCNNALVTNGFMKVTVGTGIAYYSLTNGAFSISLPACVSGAPVSIVGVDAATLSQSTAYTTTLASGTQNVGNLSACGNTVTDYIQFVVDGVPYVALQSLYSGPDSSSTTEQYFSGYTSGGGVNNEYISFKIDSNGGYSLAGLMLYGQNIPFPTSYTQTGMNVTSWANAIGQFANGSFSANYLDQSGNPHTINVNYHLPRTN